MKLKLRYISLLAAYLINTFYIRAGNDTLSCIRIADSLFYNNRFYESGNYYQKASYYSLSNKNKIGLLLKKILCLKQLKKFAEAEEIIFRTSVEGLSDTLVHDLYLQGALCSYLSANYTKAESYFIMMNYKLDDKSLLNNDIPLYALVLNELKKWTEAKEKLLYYIESSSDYSDEVRRLNKFKLDSLYNNNNYPKLKNPEKAMLLSRIVPGLGQLYSGYFWEGMGAFGINLVTFGAMVGGIYYHYYVTGLVFGNYMFGKFYVGNVGRAEFLCKKRNYIKVKKFNDNLRTFITKL